MSNQTKRIWEPFVAQIFVQVRVSIPYRTLCFSTRCRKAPVFCLNFLLKSLLEIIEYTDKDEVAVCNLASVALNMFVRRKDQETGVSPYFDHQKLFEVVCVMTENLNKVIDVNYYPIEEARKSNLRHRPIGLGVQVSLSSFVSLLIKSV